MIFSLAIIGIILVSLFLPYESHDNYSGGFFEEDVLLASGLKTPGISHIPAYIPVVFISICLAIIKINENLATAIVSLILSIINIFYMVFLAFLLVFNLNVFSGPRNYELQFGYYLSLFAGGAYVIIMIIHLIMVVRKRRNPANVPVTPSSDDLLDDRFLDV